jgi:hypothetical protein
MEKEKSVYLMLAYDYVTDKFEYQFADSKKKLMSLCKQTIKKGFGIMFASKIVVIENYTVQFFNQ